MQPAGIVASCDEEGPCDIGTNSTQCHERRRGPPHKSCELLVESGDFVLEVLPPACQAAKDVLRGRMHIRRRRDLEVARMRDQGLERRLNRGGNRDANRALWVIALVRMRCDPRTRAYVARRTSEGLGKSEILRCLKRYIVREVFKTLQGGTTTRAKAVTASAA